jgi:hypothetical protein
VSPGSSFPDSWRGTDTPRRFATLCIPDYLLISMGRDPPDYQSFMAPVLHALADGQERSMSELRTVIAEQLALTPDDLRATIPSGHSLLARDL